MVVLVGEVSEGLLAELGWSANISVARAPEAGQQDGAQPLPGWQAGALAMREAAGRQSAYVIVPDDPLAGVAAAWRAMWDVASGPGAAATFEEHAAETLAAWRGKRFELPDYYLVVAAAQAEDLGQDLYLGPLRAGRAGSRWPGPATARARPAGCWIRCAPWSTGHGGRPSAT